MSQNRPTAFSLKVGPRGEDELFVTAFSGTEELSRPFDFRADFFPASGEPLDPQALLGKVAALSLQVDQGAARVVHGQVHRVEALGRRGGFPRYRVRIVPEVEKLSHVRRSRIFQQKTTPDIVKKVLSDAGIEHRWAAGGSYASREYCVQYRESDLAFVSRLLEWEGLFYFFEHSVDKHVLVVADDATAFAPIADGAKLPFRERTGQVPGEEHVAALSLVRRVRPAAVMVRDFDFKKPALDLTADAQGGDFGALELYDYPEGYVAPGEGKRLAKVRLQEAQRDARTHDGESACPRLCPGFVFELEDPAPHGLAGKYALLRVRHFGRQPETVGAEPALPEGLYRNELHCLPDGVPFRPPRRTPWPVVPGIQTATVVGPSGEEIHPDEHGRIKVQFHWDREGNRDEKSSCWIRVAQVWGGPAWGGLFLPRIGQEVVVRFLEGDPDRPLITGAVYNGTNVTPYSLPDEKTTSTLKSNSSLGGDGFNEFRIEDAAGQEEIFVHGQKDETLVTENDKSQLIRSNEDLLVKKDRKKTVEWNQDLTVFHDDVSLVEGNQSLRVDKNRDTTVLSNHSERVKGNQSITVGKTSSAVIEKTASEAVGALKALTIGGGYAVNVGLTHSEAVGALKMETVGAAWVELVVGSRDESVSKDRATKVGGQDQTEVKGSKSAIVGKDQKDEVTKKSHTDVTAGVSVLAKTIGVKADKFSVVVDGKLALEFDKSGKIRILGKTITIEGQ
ncbi:MAG TPA: type VI secretion system tip protein TssI/VgrG [Myxococcaceae bacterium]|nr:type VI secretion system tip protein TssI/VgrG [Myxococcaceae bacterium]